MPSDASLPFRTDRLENDVASIYEIVSDIRSTQDAHTSQLDQVTQRLDMHTTQLQQLDRRLGQHDARFDQHDARFDQLQESVAEILRRLPESS